MVKIIRNATILYDSEIGSIIYKKLEFNGIYSNMNVVILLSDTKNSTNIEYSDISFLSNIVVTESLNSIDCNLSCVFSCDSWIESFLPNVQSIENGETTFILPNLIKGLVAVYTLVFYNEKHDKYVLLLNRNPFVSNDGKSLDYYLVDKEEGNYNLLLHGEEHEYKLQDICTAMLTPNSWNKYCDTTTSLFKKAVLVNDLYQLILPALPKIDKSMFINLMEVLKSPDKSSVEHALRTLIHYDFYDYSREFASPLPLQDLSCEAHSIYNSIKSNLKV